MKEGGTETVHRLLKETGIHIINYSHGDLDLEDSIRNNYRSLEIEISKLQFDDLQQLPIDGKQRNGLEFDIFTFNERLNDLKILYRMKKMKEKKKYLDSMYVKSFAGEPKEATDENNEESGNKHSNSMDDDKLKEISQQEKLLETNEKLTNKLQSVNNLMKSTLLAGEINMSDLEASTQTLTKLGESYAVFGDVLNKTNSLVKSINKASKSERVMIYRSLYFFIAVCCWILWRRIFKRPILLLIWLVLSPIKFFIFSNKGITSTENSVTAETISTIIQILETTQTTESTFTDIATQLTKDEL